MSFLVNKSTKSFNGFNNDDDDDDGDDDGYTVGGPPMLGLSCLLYPDPNNWSRVSVTSLKFICCVRTWEVGVGSEDDDHKNVAAI